MSHTGRAGARRRSSSEPSDLLASYRRALGLAAVAIVRTHKGIGVCVDAAESGEDESATAVNMVVARWWCRSAADAKRVAAAANARMNRGASPSFSLSQAAAAYGRSNEGAELEFGCASVAAAANRLGIAVQTDDEIAEEARTVAARVDAELQKLQACGGLRSINGAYRNYRLQARAGGERALRYGEWMSKFREDLIRQIAETLRSL